MSDNIVQSQGTQPPPQHVIQLSDKNHHLPRRTTAANSITLRNHRLSRDASLRMGTASAQACHTNAMSSPRRNSSGESYGTSRSDPKRWFDQSNRNPTATYDNATMPSKLCATVLRNKVLTKVSGSSFFPEGNRLVQRRTIRSLFAYGSTSKAFRSS